MMHISEAAFLCNKNVINKLTNNVINNRVNKPRQ